jgi:TRAP-type uncharacterized transport system fused permease subunit
MVLQEGSLIEIFFVSIKSLLGVIIMSGALEGYMWGIGRIGWVVRITAFVCGFLIAVPEIRTDIYGTLIAAIGVSIILLRKKIRKPRISEA